MPTPLKKKPKAKKSTANLLQRLRHEIVQKLDENMESELLYAAATKDVDLQEWREDVTDGILGLLRDRGVKLRGEEKFVDDLVGSGPDLLQGPRGG